MEKSTITIIVVVCICIVLSIVGGIVGAYYGGLLDASKITSTSTAPPSIVLPAQTTTTFAPALPIITPTVPTTTAIPIPTPIVTTPSPYTYSGDDGTLLGSDFCKRQTNGTGRCVKGWANDKNIVLACNDNQGSVNSSWDCSGQVPTCTIGDCGKTTKPATVTVLQGPGQCRLDLQGDGNLIHHNIDGSIKWGSGRYCSGAGANCPTNYQLSLQGDGNLIQTADGNSFWDAFTYSGINSNDVQTQATKPFKTVLTDDCDLEITDNTGKVFWKNNQKV